MGASLLALAKSIYYDWAHRQPSKNPSKMGNYTIFEMFENPRRGRQARNFTTNVPEMLDLKSFPENWRWVPLRKDLRGSN